MWGCHGAVKLVLWPKNADGAMAFGVHARTLREVDSTVRRKSPRKQRPPAELKQLYKCTGGPRIHAPQHAPEARKLGLTVRVAANCGMDSIQPGGVGTECRPRKRKAGRFVKDAGIAKAARAGSFDRKNVLRTARTAWEQNRPGERVAENAPAPCARKPGSGAERKLTQDMLEEVTKQGKKWRGYFSLDDMWEFLQRKCIDEGWRTDFCRDTVWRAINLLG